MEKEKLGNPGTFDLELTNAQTKKVYKNDDDLIPKNSSITVARIPLTVHVRLPKVHDRSTEGIVQRSMQVY